MDFHLDRADKKLKDQRKVREQKRKAELAKQKQIKEKARKQQQEMEVRLAAARLQKQQELEDAERRKMEEDLLTGGIEYGEVLRATALEGGGASDKVVLPQSALQKLTSAGVFDQDGAMFFELTTREGGRTHCGVREFVAEDGTVLNDSDDDEADGAEVFLEDAMEAAGHAPARATAETWAAFWASKPKVVAVDAEGTHASPPLLVQLCADSSATVLLCGPGDDGLEPDLARLLGDASVAKLFYGPPRRERLGPVVRGVDVQAVATAAVADGQALELGREVLRRLLEVRQHLADRRALRVQHDRQDGLG